MLHCEKLTAEALQFEGLNHEALNDTVLATIINRKVHDVKKLRPAGTRTAPLHSLQHALADGTGRNFILECKQSSPTLGDFCRDFNLDKLIEVYSTRAAAISVLCEEHFFKGSLSFLRYVKERCTLPVICKDFIICEEQLETAFIAGADAVLLMLSVLSEDLFLRLYQKASDLGLEVLCEVSDEKEAEFAIGHKIPVVGINNRDLKTLKIDLNNARKLYPLFDGKTVVISESGICEHSDLVSLKPIRNFLIGSSLTGSDDLVFKANSLLYGMNKVCGITTEDALLSLIRNHVSIAGLIFVEKSPRCVDQAQAAKLIGLAGHAIRFAGVFVDESIDRMEVIAARLGLDYLQLHGHESLETIKTLKRDLPKVQIIKALNAELFRDEKTVRAYQEAADLLLLDSSAPGSGRSFDWSEISAAVDKGRTLLSGGIGPDNLTKALSLGFAGLDLNSKLEKEKGIKDPHLIDEAFCIINRF